MKRLLPDILTISRICLTIAYNLYIIQNYGSVMLPVLFSIIIFITDFLDGKIARFYGITTKYGAILDVVADLFYIVLSYIVLCIYQISPIWFLLIILYKFIEFVITSSLSIKSSKDIFIFDFLGRVSAIIFYILPITIYISYFYCKGWYFILINCITVIITVFVVISSINRIYICKKSVNGICK